MNRFKKDLCASWELFSILTTTDTYVTDELLNKFLADVKLHDFSYSLKVRNTFMNSRLPKNKIFNPMRTAIIILASYKFDRAMVKSYRKVNK